MIPLRLIGYCGWFDRTRGAAVTTSRSTSPTIARWSATAQYAPFAPPRNEIAQGRNSPSPDRQPEIESIQAVPTVTGSRGDSAAKQMSGAACRSGSFAVLPVAKSALSAHDSAEQHNQVRLLCSPKAEAVPRQDSRWTGGGLAAGRWDGLVCVDSFWNEPDGEYE